MKENMVKLEEKESFISPKREEITVFTTSLEHIKVWCQHGFVAWRGAPRYLSLESSPAAARFPIFGSQLGVDPETLHIT